VDATVEATMRKLQAFLDEHFDPGTPIAVLIGLENDIDQGRLDTFKRQLTSAGLVVQIEFGETPEWPKALRLRFKKLSRKAGRLSKPLAELLAEVLSEAGVNSIAGVQVI